MIEAYVITIKRWVAFLSPPCLSMSASQANITIWSYLTPEQAYQLTVSTYILAGTLAVGTLSSQFLPSVMSDGD